MKQVVTITGIRPDFIRMSEIFKKLDENFNHILIHSGQHYDRLLSDVFFDELNIRKPDYNLEIGGSGKPHYYQTSELSIKIIELLQSQNIKPDIILFLGDSNSVCCSVQLKKEGYKIGHIEAGMRSYDRRMLEEINRVVCDHCSDYLFVYHNDYKVQAIKEGIDAYRVFVVGNTIVEVARNVINQMNLNSPKKDFILMDIHRPENFNYPERLEAIIKHSNSLSKRTGMPIKMLQFGRTVKKIEEHNVDIGNIEIIPLMSYKQFMQFQHDAFFIISDSGTAQEEPCLLGTPVIVPRDFTERLQSVKNNCSYMVDALYEDSWIESLEWVNERLLKKDMNTDWLGNGHTSDIIVNSLKFVL